MRVFSLAEIPTPSQTEHAPSARVLYDSLLRSPPTDAVRQRARDFLDTQLDRSQERLSDLPHDPDNLMAWMHDRSRQTSQAYGQYLQQRKNGAPRRYFANRAQAFSFLRQVAPTKLVDGAWLYGLLPYWEDPRVRPLVDTYLEELGGGVPALNHVSLYQQLLSRIGCNALDGLDDTHFTQGAQQLALGHLAREYFPEVLGYNLGYEQPPLHLLITVYELSELDIDAYYFQLHVTIDNASSGHAQKAVRALQNALPVVADRTDFLRRVARGYTLNELGMSSTEIIASLDLERELIAMLERKRSLAQSMHSDYARFNGLTVNQWLGQPGRMPEFLAELQTQGWIRRHQDPENSRFWRLLSGDGAAMFGVFDPCERQLLHDWIAGEWPAAPPRQHASRHTLATPPGGEHVDDEVTTLHRQLDALTPTQRSHRLIELMSPANHFSPAGLAATRLFSASVH